MPLHVIACKSNNDTGKHDASAVFVPEAEALKRLIDPENKGLEPLYLDTKYSPKEYLLGELVDIANDPNYDVDSVNVFCHGWRTGVQLLPGKRKGARRVAEALAALNTRMLNLFCCSAAKPSLLGNYCQWVQEESQKIGHRIQVFGHETAGHATKNPMVHVYWPEAGASLRTDAENFTGYRAAMQTSLEYRLTLPFRLIESGLGD